MGANQRNHKSYGRIPLSEEEKRTEKVSVFFTISEKNELILKCKLTYLTVPELLRRAVLRRKIETRRPVFDAQALELLRDIGQNLTQIKRELYSAREEDTFIDKPTLMVSLEEQLEEIRLLAAKIITQE